MDYKVLYDEISKPAYNGLDPAAVVALLYSTQVTRNRRIVSSRQIIDAFDPTEFGALAQAALLRLSIILSPQTIDIRSTVVRTTLNNIFPANSTTRTNLVALRQETVTIAESLDIGEISITDIIEARRLYGG